MARIDKPDLLTDSIRVEVVENKSQVKDKKI